MTLQGDDATRQSRKTITVAVRNALSGIGQGVLEMGFFELSETLAYSSRPTAADRI